MSELERRVSVFAALADATRLTIVDLLTLGDLSPSEISGRLGMPSNLVAHHIGVLDAAGIVSRSRSEFDKRRLYIGLRPEVFDTLTPASVAAPERVVFVCTANSARSQLAEAIWRVASDVPAASAGTRPGTQVDPGAVAAARRHDLVIDPAKQPAGVDDVIRADDLVVTVCDSAHESMLARDDLHWSIPDPAAANTADAFDTAFDDIDRRVRTLITRLAPAA